MSPSARSCTAGAESQVKASQKPFGSLGGGKAFPTGPRGSRGDAGVWPALKRKLPAPEPGAISST